MTRHANVIILTGARPGANDAYLINRLLEENLVNSIVCVRPSNLRWNLRQAQRIFRRSGFKGLWRRRHARSLRNELLADAAREFLEEGLLAVGAGVLERVPNQVNVVQTGTLASGKTLRQVSELEPDLGIQCGAGWIRGPLLGVPRLGFLSLHHGIMPAIRGMDSILWAYVENRPDWIGITLQKIDDGLDTGQIVSQERLTPEPGENPHAVMARATVVGADLLCRGVRDVLTGREVAAATGRTKGVYRSALTPEAVRTLHKMIEAKRTPSPGNAP